MKVYIVTSDGFNYDIPVTNVFDSQQKAVGHVLQCWLDWLGSHDDLDPLEPCPDAEPTRDGLLYRFEDDLNNEWYYVSEGVLQ